MAEGTAHKAWFIGLMVVNLLVLLLLYFLNYANAQMLGDLFKHSISNQSAKYYLQITPAGWTFSIWGFIFTWQGIWVIYSLVLMCRPTPEGPAYLNPILLPPALFVFYICANTCVIAWLFLFDRDVIEGAFVAILGIPIFITLGMVVSYRCLDAVSPRLVEQGRSVNIWLVRAFVHNGLGIYGTWTAIASLLNLAMVIRYRSDPVIGDETASTAALVVLTLEILAFVSTDLLLLDRYSRYTVTPYIVVVVALIGSIAKNWEDGATNSIFTAVLLAVGTAGLVLKVVMLFYRHFTRAPYPSISVSTLDKSKDVPLA